LYVRCFAVAFDVSHELAFVRLNKSKVKNERANEKTLSLTASKRPLMWSAVVCVFNLIVLTQDGILRILEEKADEPMLQASLLFHLFTNFNLIVLTQDGILRIAAGVHGLEEKADEPMLQASMLFHLFTVSQL
jgi:hypothetical protein